VVLHGGPLGWSGKVTFTGGSLTAGGLYFDFLSPSLSFSLLAASLLNRDMKDHWFMKMAQR